MLHAIRKKLNSVCHATVRTAFILLLIAGLFAGPKPVSAAATFNVDTTVDAHLANPAGTECIDTNGFCSVRAAFEAANNTPSSVVDPNWILIPVSATPYTLTLGELKIGNATNKVTNIHGHGAYYTTLQQTDHTNRIITANPNNVPDVTVRITNLGLTGGNARVDSRGLGGGAIVAGGTTGNVLHIASCLFMDNRAIGDGGAINFTGGLLVISNTSFTGNTSETGSGGAIYITSADGTIDAEIHLSRFVGNSAVATSGIYYTGPGIVNADNNWWGSNAGPGIPGNDSVNGSVLADPWLVLSISASTNTVNIGEDLILTANANTNSNGVSMTLSGHLLDVTPILFSAVSGSVTPTMTHLVTGEATSTFTAGPTQTTSSAGRVTLDNQTVAVTICITGGTTKVTSTTISGLPATIVYGQSVVITATTAVVAPATGTPAGTVTFKDGTTELGSQTLDGSGQATFTTHSLSAGTHQVTAEYAGEGGFLGSTSATPFTVDVSPASTYTALACSKTGYLETGQPVTFTATITSGAGSPTGIVRFYDDGSLLGSAAINGGTASISITFTNGGTHPIRASYAGDGNFTGSDSSTLTQNVKYAVFLPFATK